MTRKMIQLSSIGFLVIGLIFTSSTAFAYWNDVTTARTVEDVTIGEPVEVSLNTIQTISESLYLVPEGRAIFSDQIETAEFIYEIGVSRELLQTVNLIVSINEILINDSDQYAHLVVIDIMEQGEYAVLDIGNDLVRIFVTVTLLEPIDEAEANLKGFDVSRVNVEDSQTAFEAIVGEQINFGLIFELEPKDIDSNNN